MRHLIVESCISRQLLDTSAYYWPGYIMNHANSTSHTLPSQLAGWSSFMKGAPLTQPLVNMLVSTPASRCVPPCFIYQQRCSLIHIKKKFDHNQHKSCLMAL
jgi:hypothetical protein